jgi:hypothetical protein
MYRWREELMLTPDATGQYLIDPGSKWHRALCAGGQIGVEYRPWDSWSVALTAYGARKGRDTHLGIRIVGSGILSLGWPQIGG